MNEKIIIVGVETPQNMYQFPYLMKELENLVETAGGEVVYQLVQKRSVVNRQTILGKGKLEELAALVDVHEVDLVVINQELTPRQNRAIEDVIVTGVIDRVQLILDIFALRAKSKEGQMQVELAQLNYLLPRLTGQGKHLSRLGAGIGTRGPGETKLESDRRHIRKKITNIKKDLQEVQAHRERNRQKRKNANVFQIGLIGYTNAGKSTILNFLTEAGAYAENQLFATLDPLTKKLVLPSGMETTLTDTVGFIQEIPTQLVEAFQSTLEESSEMNLLLHVVDASAVNRLEQEKTVNQLVNKLDMKKIPILTIYNKKDLVDPSVFTPTLFPNLLISATYQEDREILLRKLEKVIKVIFEQYKVLLSSEESHLLNQIKKETLVEKEEYSEENNSFEVSGFAPKGSYWLSRNLLQ